MIFKRSIAMNPLMTVENVVVRQDAYGRYCLNDLHRASGGANRHRPSRWAENNQTQALVAEISQAGIPAWEVVVHSGNRRETYVCRELVHAYAMWISAAFQLKVIRSYDALERSNLTNAVPASPDLTPLLAAKDQIIAAQAQTIAAQAEAVAMSKRGMDAMQLAVELSRPKPKGPPKERLTDMDVREACAKRHQGKTVTQIAREMGLSPSTISQITRSVVMD
jgi:DNA-binding NarL/FixJ family response regulator